MPSHVLYPISAFWRTASQPAYVRLPATLAGLLLVALLAACGDININVEGDDDAISGSGEVITKDFDLDGFSTLEVSNAFDVSVLRSDEFSVSITADDNIMEVVEVQRSGDVLRIGIEPGINLRSPRTLEARVAMPELRGVDLSGASQLEFRDFAETMSVDLNLSGASFIQGDLKGEDVRVGLSGASRAELSGSSVSLDLDCSGASGASLESLTVERATSVQLSGASHASISVTDAIERIDLSGASHLEYGGDPTLGEVATSGVSDLQHR